MGRAIAILVTFMLFLGSIGAWITHVIWAIKTLASDAGITFGQIVLAVLGTFVPPVGVIHGVIIWFS